MKQSNHKGNCLQLVDVVSPEKRSQMMAGIKGKDTKPEVIIRRALFKQGFRYRINDRSLPGKPDIVLKKYNAIIQVNGCFWHGHDCHLFKWPSTRPEFWKEKISRNKTNDRKKLEKLRELGWRALIVWECALRGKTKLEFESLLNDVSLWIISDTTFMEIRGK